MSALITNLYVGSLLSTLCLKTIQGILTTCQSPDDKTILLYFLFIYLTLKFVFDYYESYIELRP